MCVCVCETVNVYVSVCGGWGVGRQMCLCVWGAGASNKCACVWGGGGRRLR